MQYQLGRKSLAGWPERIEDAPKVWTKKGSRFLYQLPDQVTSGFIPVIIQSPWLEGMDDCGKHDAVGDQNVHGEECVDNTGQDYQKIRFHFAPPFLVCRVLFCSGSVSVHC
jgi:hypothetical protein